MSAYIRKKKYDMATALNEMASDKADYENALGTRAAQLYNHLIYVCVLEDSMSEMVHHWAKEIYNFTYKAIDIRLRASCKNLDRVKVIEQEMMAPQMGIYFEDYCADHFIDALEDEKGKAERQLNNSECKNIWPLLKKEINCIDEALKHIDDYVDLNKARLEAFYDRYKQATAEKQLDLLTAAIEAFIQNK